MQSWRSIREALGNRPGSGNHLVSDEGEEPQVARPPAIFPVVQAMRLNDGNEISILLNIFACHMSTGHKMNS